MNDAYKIVPSSPQLGQSKPGNPKFKSKYPWQQLGIGQSFALPKDKYKWQEVLSMASKASKRYGMCFRAYNHGEAGYEIGRLPDPASVAAQAWTQPVETPNQDALAEHQTNVGKPVFFKDDDK